MGKKNIRIWQSLEIDEVKKHLIITEDVIGMCANCKELNIHYKNHSNCPSCNTTFQYITVKNDSMSDIHRILESINKGEINLKLVDYKDYENATAKDKISDLFKK